MSSKLIGQAAPDVVLKTIDDAPIALSEMWGNGQPTLLIFLRHLA